jgi:LysM repeat protein
MLAARTPRRTYSAGGPERFMLGAALLIPLGVVLIAVTQLPGTTLASPSSLIHVDAVADIVSKRPVASNPAPPPTLVPATATPRPTATPVLPTAVATPKTVQAGTYVVQPGDELKHIAASHDVSIWKIIAANNIPDPDSLKIGQVLTIPSS